MKPHRFRPKFYTTLHPDVIDRAKKHVKGSSDYRKNQSIAMEPEIEILPAVDPADLEQLPEEWCIVREDNPEMGLCGSEVNDENLPDDEVPDEITCPDCLRIQRQNTLLAK